MNCTECGADTIKSLPLCRHCKNDPDYADYRWDIWDDEQEQRECLEDDSFLLLEQSLLVDISIAPQTHP